ncbi:MAG: type I-E CRISPR-associated protein Cas5/CasD [Candidatus Methanomethylophilaceae archaeon]|nr:type I-E CRISPR-associated protein Cas5/CasD [Candidatus Methanomethylophilaceae archaeon]
MPVLLMRLEGPMQSWGTYSRFSERDTGLEPSKSGVIGLICSAMGRERGEDVSDLSSLRMAVRIDREGRYSNDYHTAINVPRAGSKGTDTSLSNRYYLADASFVVFIEGEADLLHSIQAALDNPKHCVFLGRKSFPPSTPILMPGGLKSGTIEENIRRIPLSSRDSERKPERVRVVMECSIGEGEMKMDVPISFQDRDFIQRYVKTLWVDIKDLPEGC